MAQRWHWLRIRTTCHPTEDPGRVRRALQACTGLDDEGFAAALTETEFDSHHGGKVTLMEVLVERAREIRGALSIMWTPGVRAQLLEQAEARTDENGVFHWRMGKQSAFQGTLESTSGDDAVQARLKPEVHPASREAALQAVVAFLQE